MAKKPSKDVLGTKEVIANTARALVKFVPGVGSGADQLIFGEWTGAKTR